ncbi:hypothetical protein STAR110904_06750 [Staphylococcus argensis]
MMSDWLMYILIIGMMLPEMIIGVKKLYQKFKGEKTTKE